VDRGRIVKRMGGNECGGRIKNRMGGNEWMVEGL